MFARYRSNAHKVTGLAFRGDPLADERQGALDAAYGVTMSGRGPNLRWGLGVRGRGWRGYLPPQQGFHGGLIGATRTVGGLKPTNVAMPNTSPPEALDRNPVLAAMTANGL